MKMPIPRGANGSAGSSPWDDFDVGLAATLRAHLFVPGPASEVRSGAHWLERLDAEAVQRAREYGAQDRRLRLPHPPSRGRGAGRHQATGRLVELGLAVGVIAAQSIGEAGTQLTMRMFHIGGTASRVSEQSTLDAKHSGTVRYKGLQVVESRRPARRRAS